VALTAAQLGNRLATARTNAGLTLDDAAQKVGLAPKDLEDIENGIQPVPASRILELSKHYGVPASTIILGSNPASLQVKFRAQGSPRDRVLAAIGLQHEALTDLLEILNRRVSPSLPNLNLPVMPDAITDGEEAARAFRAHLGLTGPIPDLHALVQKYGVQVLEATLPEDVSGIYVRGERGEESLLIQPEDTDGRQRFSLAHELGHALLDIKEQTIVSERNSTQALEVRANAFAGELLLPGSELRAYCKRRGKEPGELDFIQVADLAAEYHLTYAAAVYRLLVNRSINNSQYEALMAKERNANGYRAGRLKEAPATANRQSLDGVGFLLARKALKADLITAKKFREYGTVFGVPADVITTYLEA
jgi:Zn-dependent peptidase ImmA (M78 family)/DNA-binding XRE family transcriptional regulator